jgi:hypothetical protein
LRKILALPFLARSLSPGCSLVSPEDRPAAGHNIHDRQHRAIGSEPRGNLAIIAHLKHGQIRVFSSFDAAFVIG